MNINKYAEILESVWNGLPSHYPNVVLHEHIIRDGIEFVMIEN